MRSRTCGKTCLKSSRVVPPQTGRRTARSETCGRFRWLARCVQAVSRTPPGVLTKQITPQGAAGDFMAGERCVSGVVCAAFQRREEQPAPAITPLPATPGSLADVLAPQTDGRMGAGLHVTNTTQAQLMAHSGQLPRVSTGSRRTRASAPATAAGGRAPAEADDDRRKSSGGTRKSSRVRGNRRLFSQFLYRYRTRKFLL